jgi:hypothetical protein
MTTFLQLVAEGLIPDIDTAAMQIKEQVKLKSNVYRFICVQDINVSLFQMALNYRHDIGVHQAAHVADGEKLRVPIKNANNSLIRFKTREELSLFFAPKAHPIWPENSLWMQAQTRRIIELEQKVQGLTKALSNMK